MGKRIDGLVEGMRDTGEYFGRLLTGSFDIAKSGVQRAAGAAQTGASGLGYLLQERREILRIQEERDRLRAEPEWDGNENALPFYGDGGTSQQETIGSLAHRYYENGGSRALGSAALYTGLGVAGNLGSWATGEESVNTLVDMSAGPIAYANLIRGGERSTALEVLLASVVGWNVASELMNHPSDDMLGHLKQAYEAVTTAVLYGPRTAGAVAGVIAPAAYKIKKGKNAERERLERKKKN
jgi:hypothetical protein